MPDDILVDDIKQDESNNNINNNIDMMLKINMFQN